MNHKRIYLYGFIILFGVVSLGLSKKVYIPTTILPIVVPREQSQRQVQQREYISISAATKQVPILMYHYIRSCTDPEDKHCPALSVTPETFGEQLAWFQDHGYTTVDLDYFTKPYKVLGQPFIITFDDGYQDTYDTALPLLERYGFTATWYIISDRIGDEGYLTWEKVLDIYQRGMTIGSHTLDHKDMSSLLAPEVVRETVQSRNAIAQHLGVAIYDFCYPYGRHNILSEEAVQQAGYRTATTTKVGIAAFDDDLMRLPRLRMIENTDLGKVLEIN